ncbi:MAG: 50S ribosomal protein L23 [Candidatus Babeliaceae bacterium]|jgi:large subunit ribosomal protein L23
MDLNIYEIIKKPHITTKAYTLNQRYNQIVVDVHPMANKPEIAKALKRLFNVEVDKIRIIVSKGKTRRSGRHVFHGPLRKKAIIVLKKGHSLDLTGWKQSSQVPEQSASAV